MDQINEYQPLTLNIQVPVEWPVESGRKVIKELVHNAIILHQLGKRVVITIKEVSALITDNETKSGYVLKKIQEENDEDTYKIDMILPVKISMTVLQSDYNEIEMESVELFPMNFTTYHPISKLLVPSSERHKIVIAVPILEAILRQKDITGPEMYNCSLQTTYRVHKVKKPKGIVSEKNLDRFLSTDNFSVSTKKISDDEWNIVCYDRLPQPTRVWCNRKKIYTSIRLSLMLLLLILLGFLWGIYQ